MTTARTLLKLQNRLQDVGIKALTIHGRTRAQLYKGNADWTLIGEVKNNPRMKIPDHRKRGHHHTPISRWMHLKSLAWMES